jgi:hypothetical protein
MNTISACVRPSRSNSANCQLPFKFPVGHKFLVAATVFSEHWARSNFGTNFKRSFVIGDVIGRRFHKGSIPLYTIQVAYDKQIIEWKDYFVEKLKSFGEDHVGSSTHGQGFIVLIDDNRETSNDTVRELPSLISGSLPASPPPAANVSKFSFLFFFTLLSSSLILHQISSTNMDGFKAVVADILEENHKAIAGIVTSDHQFFPFFSFFFKEIFLFLGSLLRLIEKTFHQQFS